MDEERIRIAEAELGRLMPAEVPAGLKSRIRRDVEERLTMRERVLAVWMGMSAAAALYVAVTVVWQVQSTAGAPERPVASEHPRMPADIAREVQLLLAAR